MQSSNKPPETVDMARRVTPSTKRQPTSRMRLGMVVHCFISFVICNMDRINLSVSILPMQRQYNWSARTAGLVQSVFFAGYMTTQIIGGYAADRIGGRTVLAAGVLVWSLSTLLTPLVAVSMPLLLAARVVLGVGEGVAMPAMNAIVSAYVLAEQRARSLSFIYSGMYAGSILGLLLAPVFIAYLGWPSVFYFFGIVGLIWVLVFLLTTYPTDSRYDVLPLHDAQGEATAVAETQPHDDKPSLREIFSKPCIWAIIVAHFCCTWGYFVCLTWLPTYLNSRFDRDVTQSALLSIAPWMSMFVCANIGGSIADHLIACRGLSVTHTRKLMQSIGFIGPAVFLSLTPSAANAYVAMAYISTALGFASFSQSGVYANHQDVGPRIAGTLLGISNTFASLPGIIGVYSTGVLLEVTHGNWNAVFGLAVLFYLVGLVVYNVFATGEQQW